MSHMVKGNTSFTEENKKLLIEALETAYNGSKVELNAQANISGRPICDIVVRRNNGNDVGFRVRKDGTYECLTYEPGYGNSQNRINEAMKPVYEPYNRAVAKKMIKDTPALSGWIVKKETKEVEHKGKKMKRIRIQPGGGGGWI